MIFKEAWEAAFIVDNTRKAFAKAGVYPVDASKTISMIERKPAPERLPDNPLIPMTCRSVWRIIKAHKDKPEKATALMMRSLERLASQHEIDVYVNKGLQKALIYEKQKRAEAAQKKAQGAEKRLQKEREK
jgi:hypothetical protein